eukprot:UN05648
MVERINADFPSSRLTLTLISAKCFQRLQISITCRHLRMPKLRPKFR